MSGGPEARSGVDPPYGPETHVLPPDAAEERRTRSDYRLAATAALARLGDDRKPGGKGPSASDGSPEGFVSRRETLPSNTMHARTQGWLVTGEAPAMSAPAGNRLGGYRIAVKDVIDVAGLPTRNGSPGGAWREPVRSARAWAALAAEGAVCIGKAATHEMAWGVTTPQIPHPLDPSRVTGGSSGGSAAVVAAGLADAALGTDTGGSIRIPAALCGVVGMRPTLGSVPSLGVTPLAPSQDSVGALAPDIGTCGAVMEVLLERQLSGPLPDRLAVGVPAKVGYLDSEVASAWSDALTTMRSAGVDLVELPEIPLKDSGAVSLLTMLIESADHHAEAVLSGPHAFGGEARALLTLGTELTAHRHRLTLARAALLHTTERLFVDHGLAAILTPTTACVAPRRDADTVTLGDRQVPVSVALTAFTAWASATGLPAISVPMASPGLPVGIQMMAPRYAEETCLKLGLILERSGR